MQCLPMGEKQKMHCWMVVSHRAAVMHDEELHIWCCCCGSAASGQGFLTILAAPKLGVRNVNKKSPTCPDGLMLNEIHVFNVSHQYGGTKCLVSACVFFSGYSEAVF